MKIVKAAKSRLGDVDMEHLGFGEVFSDHMLSVEYKDGQWDQPEILPYGPIELYPSVCSLHYGQVIFEGLKAFYGENGEIHIFRPEKYHERMHGSCKRLCIPQISLPVFLEGLKELISLDRGWVPRKRGFSLYIRPFIFATENFLGVKVSETYRFLIITGPVGAYYKEGINPVKLITPGGYVRASKGGLGAAKTPANYAATLFPAEEAKKKGFTQVLWLDGIEQKYVEEVGTMNLFFLIGDELITPPLEGTILPGVTRDSVLHLARDWGIRASERRLSMEEILTASRKGSLQEVFGSGTAAVISPVGEIHHEGQKIVIHDNRIGPLAQRLYDEITGIQYGEKPDKFGWRVTVSKRVQC
jgi:branched-chain amino acid aminotransferase